MEKIRIVIADDHWLMRDGTRHILEECPTFEVVGDAEDGEQALELIERLQPDIVVLDIRMPKLSGIEVVRETRKVSPNTRSLILTAYDDDAYIFALIEAGAGGYLLKTCRPSELIDAVQRIYQGESVLHPSIAMKVARLWIQSRGSNEQMLEPLTPREREVLQQAANGLRTQAIAERLSISSRTAEGHLHRVYSKFGCSSRMEAILFALSQHIVFIDPEDNARTNDERT